MNKLNHLALIMDGNGRWAKSRGHNRIWGHIRGARVAKNIIAASVEKKIPCLSLFAFSTENWQRSKEEVSFLMSLLARNLKREINQLQKSNVRFHCIGDLNFLPNKTRDTIQECIQKTQSNNGMDLIFAVSYSGKQDLLSSVKALAQQVKSGELSPEDITEDSIEKHLNTSSFPDPDLIIRTSGETRLSNFYLWQAAYAELEFSQKMWPEFTIKDFNQILHKYSNTERRYGTVLENDSHTSPN